MFLYSSWLSLPIQIRIKLASQFGITKTGSTHVVGNSVQSDGYVVRDVEKALSIPAIQQFLGTKETSGDKLWTMLVDKVEGKVPTPSQVPTALSVPTTVPKKRGRPFKNQTNVQKI